MEKDNYRSVYKNGKRIHGLKQVHIGENTWFIGKVKNEHCVIYGPNKKQYHVYGEDILFLRTELENDSSWAVAKRKYEGVDLKIGSYVNRQGNDTIEGNVKIYILTSILDNKENWCFDLNKIPDTKYLKVIYNTGQIKNIEFNGIFESVEVKTTNYNFKYKIHPIAYRI